jgi:hypothetical protein
MSEPSGKNGAPIVEHKPNEIEPSALSLALGARPDYGGGWTSAKLDDGLGGA